MKDSFLPELGKRIYELRKELRYSQEELAEKADISKQTVSIIENGKREILGSNIVGIADALGVSTDYLLKGVRNDADLARLDKRVRDFTPEQFKFLEGFIDGLMEYSGSK